MGHSFRLMRVLLVLDDRVIFDRKAGGEWALPHFVYLSTGAQSPGEHELRVSTNLRGYGEGKNAYLNGYQFELKSFHWFVVPENQAARVEVIQWEKGGEAVPLEQRPAILYLEGFSSRPGPPTEAPGTTLAPAGSE